METAEIAATSRTVRPASVLRTGPRLSAPQRRRARATRGARGDASRAPAADATWREGHAPAARAPAALGAVGGGRGARRLGAEPVGVDADVRYVDHAA